MTKITFIGAGSTVFAKNLLGDILSFPELADSTISLMDIDPERLQTSEIVAHKVADFFGAKPKIEATLDRRRALDGADYAISMFQVGGYKPSTVIDFEIPKKYGIQQTIADTLGIGGIMRGLAHHSRLSRYLQGYGRTLPRRDVPAICQPDGDEYLGDQPRQQNQDCRAYVTACRELPKCWRKILACRTNEINYICAGINHMAFYLKFERNGEDLYPKIRQVAEAKTYARGYRELANHVRYEMLQPHGIFRHRVERALQRVCAVVHQTKPT